MVRHASRAMAETRVEKGLTGFPLQLERPLPAPLQRAIRRRASGGLQSVSVLPLPQATTVSPRAASGGLLRLAPSR